jgi:hypothetical protein
VRSKLLQRIEGREVAARACHALAAGCDQVIAVVRPDSPAALTQVLQQAGAQQEAQPVARVDRDDATGDRNRCCLIDDLLKMHVHGQMQVPPCHRADGGTQARSEAML